MLNDAQRPSIETRLCGSRLQDSLKNMLTIVIPVLNEEEAIGRVIDELLDEGYKPSQIIVVDGHSTDATREEAAARGVRVVEQEGRGKTDAVRTAARLVETKYMLVMDGDYTYPASHIAELLSKAEEGGYDEVIGSRRYGRSNIPAVNRLGNVALTWFFNLLFGTRLTDVLSGMYIVRTGALREVVLESKGFGVESEIAAYIASSGGRIGEHPIGYRRRVGEKKLRVSDGARIALEILRLAWRYNPVFFIALIGSILLLPGLVLAAYVAYNYLAYGVKYFVKGLLASALTGMGVVSLLLAVLALYLKRMEWRLMRELKRVRRCMEHGWEEGAKTCAAATRLSSR